MQLHITKARLDALTDGVFAVAMTLGLVALRRASVGGERR
jgi:uncharacterized membrane protein